VFETRVRGSLGTGCLHANSSLAPSSQPSLHLTYSTNVEASRNSSSSLSSSNVGPKACNASQSINDRTNVLSILSDCEYNCPIANLTIKNKIILRLPFYTLRAFACHVRVRVSA
jgi:hypothetical protein